MCAVLNTAVFCGSLSFIIIIIIIIIIIKENDKLHVNLSLHYMEMRRVFI